MGGRKSYFLKDVVGTGKKVGLKKAQLTKSFNSGDITGVAVGSANLTMDHRNIAKILIYSKLLFTHIKEKYKPDELRNLREINRRVRIDWSNLKDRKDLESNQIINSAVIDSVSKALKERA